MFYIESERLKLIPLNLVQLRIYQQPPILAQELGLSGIRIENEPFFQHEFDDALANYWLPMVEKNPDHYEWFTNWLIVLKQENAGIGGIGLTGLPDANGETEVGYGIGLDYRKRGYASEALQCLCAWAFQHPALMTVVAHTPADLLSSQKVLQKAGFQFVKIENELIKWAREKTA